MDAGACRGFVGVGEEDSIVGVSVDGTLARKAKGYGSW